MARSADVDLRKLCIFFTSVTVKPLHPPAPPDVTHPAFRPSQPSQCLNLLFVMQVISEEGVSFKVSLFLHRISLL